LQTLSLARRAVSVAGALVVFAETRKAAWAQPSRRKIPNRRICKEALPSTIRARSLQRCCLRERRRRPARIARALASGCFCLRGFFIVARAGVTLRPQADGRPPGKRNHPGRDAGVISACAFPDLGRVMIFYGTTNSAVAAGIVRSYNLAWLKPRIGPKNISCRRRGLYRPALPADSFRRAAGNPLPIPAVWDTLALLRLRS